MTNTVNRKIVVIQFSGNAGKTTVARNLLLPRLPHGTQLVSIESINADDGDGGGEQFRGKDFTRVMQDVDNSESIVVDVGASNVESFLLEMKRNEGSVDAFDYFVIPTVPKKKQIKDTLNTIEALHDLGIPKGKVRIVFNQVASDLDDSYEDEVKRSFSPIFAAANDPDAGEWFTCNPLAFVPESELFSRLNGESIESVLSTTSMGDLKSMLSNTSDKDERFKITYRIGTVRVAQGMNRALNNCFDALMA